MVQPLNGTSFLRRPRQARRRARFGYDAFVRSAGNSQFFLTLWCSNLYSFDLDLAYAAVTSLAHEDSLSSQVRVLVDRRGRGVQRIAVRRPYLFDRPSTLMLECQTAFVDHECSHNALHSQIATLRDLAFFREWSLLRAERNASWAPPERRAVRGERAFTEAEVLDLSRWCQLDADSIASARRLESRSTPVIAAPKGKTVDTSTTNRRLRTIKHYLKWLTLMASTGINSSDAALTSEAFCHHLDVAFENHIKDTKKTGTPKSLEHEERKTLRTLVGKDNEEVYDASAHGTRDKLIVRLLLEGLRAGELLKATTQDVDDNFEIRLGKRIAVIHVERRPNDPDDERTVEPAVKTLPGTLAIGRRLAADLVNYVREERRFAVNRRSDGRETHQLFVCHSGPNIGRAISQRNLNRIVARLKGRSGLPDSLSPHTLRHTHMTEIEEVAASKGKTPADIRSVLLDRGRWSPKSTMPELYTQRATMESSADLIERRDELLEKGHP